MRRHPDALLAIAVAVVALAVSALDAWLRGQPLQLTGVRAVAEWAVPVVAVCAPLAVRRRAPLTAVLASAAVVLVSAFALRQDAGTWVLALAVASAAYHRHRLRLVLLAASVGWAVTMGDPDVAALSVYAAAGAAPVAAGYALRLRADRAAQAVRLQRAREERARAQEAARIARDVHDIVGHHLSAIRLQAVGGRRALAGRDPDADRALEGIAALSAEALAEIRALIATLVRPDPEPPRGLADLPGLAARSGGSELDVTLDLAPGLDDTLTPDTAACVYRVVQESLTNAATHSAAGKATVKLRESATGVTLTIDDPGPRRRSPAPGAGSDGGRGLPGMGERVAALGGRFHAGPRGRHGWRVRADLPADPPTAAHPSDAGRPGGGR
ncbi:sensor histidine kinase [Nonomuraea sp. SBT364]|uniref:sensor histidine kinase n=1 Tax=Nonomuraea sp. SBT364 TaxID=1580530 RepID=UPI00066D3422|nr:histidine kinase [Nonomuraea sp. SBT364]